MDGFVCQRCGNCCRIEGQVRLLDTDIVSLARFFGLSEHEYIQRYTRIAHDRDGLALLDGKDGACIYLTANGCQVQAAKPRQCRDFPSRWTNPNWREICAGSR
jgi:uncharacterized protein